MDYPKHASHARELPGGTGRAGRPASLTADRAGIAGIGIATTLILGAVAGVLPPGLLGSGMQVLLLAVAALLVARIIELAGVLADGSPLRASRTRGRPDHRHSARGGFGRNTARQKTRVAPERESA